MKKQGYAVTKDTTPRQLADVMIGAYDQNDYQELELLHVGEIGEREFKRVVFQAKELLMYELTNRHARRVKRGDFETAQQTMQRLGMTDDEYAAHLLS